MVAAWSLALGRNQNPLDESRPQIHAIELGGSAALAGSPREDVVQDGWHGMSPRNFAT
jgi:hypothetical protein